LLNLLVKGLELLIEKVDVAQMVCNQKAMMVAHISVQGLL